MLSVCWHFLSVNVPLLAALSQHNIKTTTCSSINHYKFHSEFLSAETHYIWLLHYLKITEKFQTNGEQIVFLSLTENNLPNLGSPNLQMFRWSKQNIQEFRTAVRASHFIIAGNLIIHSVYPFNKLHGEDGGNWIGLIHKIVTFLQICQFYFTA